jgi:hypothetical protein
LLKKIVLTLERIGVKFDKLKRTYNAPQRMQVLKNVLQMYPLAAHNIITSPKSASLEKKSYRVDALLVLSTLWAVSAINSWEGEVVTPK